MALGHYVNAFLTMTRKDGDLANKVGNFLPYCSVLVCKLESKFDRPEKFWDFYESSLQVKPSVPSPTARSPFAVCYCENVFQREARTELQRRNDQKFTQFSRNFSFAIRSRDNCRRERYVRRLIGKTKLHKSIFLRKCFVTNKKNYLPKK